jgi:hypothetical protein
VSTGWAGKGKGTFHGVRVERDLPREGMECVRGSQYVDIRVRDMHTQ